MPLDGISLQIEQLVAKEQISYVDATLHFCKKLKLDPDEIKDIVHPNIVDKLKTEFIKNNHFPDKKLNSSLSDFFSD